MEKILSCLVFIRVLQKRSRMRSKAVLGASAIATLPDHQTPLCVHPAHPC